MVRIRSLLAALGLLAAFGAGVVASAPVIAAVTSMGVIACNATIACSGARNAGPGSGLLGVSNSGFGTVGQTTFDSSNAGIPQNGKAGVFGLDLSPKGSVFNAGVLGTSTYGYGMYARSTNGTGILGQTMANQSVSNGQAAIEGDDLSKTSPQNTGVLGKSVRGAGVTARGGGYGLFAESGGSYAVYADATSSNGAISAQSAGGDGIDIQTDGTYAGITAIGITAPKGAAFFQAVGPNNSGVLIDSNANIDTTGRITTSGSCHVGCEKRGRIRSYAAAAASPTLEDTGEAQLAGGVAFVRLDASFANAIDAQRGYYVFLTPEGDTRGLSVVQRGPTGFAVRETMGGRSNVAFMYRIVAHPYGVNEPRLPLVTMRATPRSNRNRT